MINDIDAIDGALAIPDSKTIAMIYHLLHEDGLYLGASSAMNVVACQELAVKLGKGSRVVTILCDGAYRFVLSFFFPLFSLFPILFILLPRRCVLKRNMTQIPVATILANLVGVEESRRAYSGSFAEIHCLTVKSITPSLSSVDLARF